MGRLPVLAEVLGPKNRAVVSGPIATGPKLVGPVAVMAVWSSMVVMGSPEQFSMVLHTCKFSVLMSEVAN